MKTLIYISLILVIVFVLRKTKPNHDANFEWDHLDKDIIPTFNYPTAYNISDISWSYYVSPEFMPNYLQSVEALNGCKTTRISDETAFGIGDVFEKRHAYSTRSPFNADSSLICLGVNKPKILNGNTYELLGSTDYRIIWSNVQPLKCYSNWNNIFEVNTINPQTLKLTNVRTRVFNDYYKMNIGGSNGNLSNDDKYVALEGTKSSTGKSIWVLVYDVEEDKIISERNFGGNIDNDLQWVGMAQDGSRVVIQFDKNGLESRQGTKSYNLNLQDEVNLTYSTSHGDIGVDTEGNQVFVYFKSEVSGYDLTMSKLLDGKKTGLFLGNLHGGHISCRNILRPGWCYVSTYGNPNDTNKEAPLENFALELKQNGLVAPISKNCSELAYNVSYYNQQAHTCPNPIGTKILFSSSFGNSTEELKTYGLAFISELL